MITNGAHAVASADREKFPYKMKDLCEKTGLPRQVIHFYIAQGLLPEGHKTGRNMAYYGEEHLERILLVRRLQHERFLPLKTIKAILDEREDAFTPVQRQLLREVQGHLGPNLVQHDGPQTVDVDEVLARVGLTEDDLAGLVEVGLLAMVEQESKRLIARDDVWLLELWADVRGAGLSKELGFSTRDIAMYAEAIDAVFAKETPLIAGRVSHLPAAQVADMVERALPLINTFLSRYHLRRVRQFFSTL
ncbi:MAG: MerR family transcriptional regulator [Polyangiales bacterium]